MVEIICYLPNIAHHPHSKSDIIVISS